MDKNIEMFENQRKAIMDDTKISPKEKIKRLLSAIWATEDKDLIEGIQKNRDEFLETVKKEAKMFAEACNKLDCMQIKMAIEYEKLEIENSKAKIEALEELLKEEK